MDAYFDTNVYGHIYRRDDGVTDALVSTLEDAVQSQAVRIFTSYAVVEETNAARLKYLDETNGRFELIRTLAVQERVVRLHSEIIDADIRAYANGEESPDKFQKAYPRLREVFWDHTAKHYKELDSYARDTQHAVDAFTKDLDDSFNRLIRPLAKEAKKEKKQQSFSDYWDEMSEPWVEQLASKYGMLDECRAKGLKGLLDIHSIRISTIAQVSLTYANTYEREKFARGNSRDMQHVVCASAVPIFVTHDRELTRLLARMPSPNLEIVDLHTLMARIVTEPRAVASGSRFNRRM